MRVTIHQPEHMPWLGFFHKINMADVYVTLDNVQFRKDYFHNRNQIRAANGKTWITVPVKNKNAIQIIKDVEISYDHKWIKRYSNLIDQNYAKSPFYERYIHDLVSIIKNSYSYLCALNIDIIKFLLKNLGIQTKVVHACELQLPHCKGPTAVNWHICKALNAKTYISGISGKEYLDETPFKKDNINVEYQEFHHPIYEQLYKPFVPLMSVIDLLFNYGEKSLDVINGVGVPVMKRIFH